MKKTITLIMLAMMLSACSKPLAVLEDKDAPLIVDIRDEFDPKSILSDLKEGTEVSYVLDEENSKVVITLTNGKRTETIEKEVTVQYPLAVFKSDDMTIDLYTGYDVYELVDILDGVTLDSALDEESSTLTVTAVLNDRTESISSPVTIIDTTPTPFGRTYELHSAYYYRNGFERAYGAVPNDDYYESQVTFIDESDVLFVYFAKKSFAYCGPSDGRHPFTQEYLNDIAYVNDDFSYFELKATDCLNGFTGELAAEVHVTYFKEITDPALIKTHE